MAVSQPPVALGEQKIESTGVLRVLNQPVCIPERIVPELLRRWPLLMVNTLREQFFSFFQVAAAGWV